ncbi:major facilitator superfamily transporter [Fusarium beomiforme]|uniref:Major facilitator superfamily transporter n=1 Tax=Fusarium beomiforme TaxID=44412 RepID=A0A9P5AMR2_9HYPO|nr:major facilitator superfamily transporter [Fusarium beomiforme]
MSTVTDQHRGTTSAEIDPTEERRLVWKLDLHLLPLMAMVYLLQYLDKHAINCAAASKLIPALELGIDDFINAFSLFYIGQVIADYPVAYILSRYHFPHFVIGATVIAWSVAETCVGALSSDTENKLMGFSVTRFFLGVSESAISPSFVVLISNWYRRREHPERVAAWMCMNGIGQMIISGGFAAQSNDLFLYNLPTGGFSFATVWISALIPRFFPGTRIYTATALTLLPLAGSSLIVALPLFRPTPPVRWEVVIATWLANAGSAPLCACASLVASNVKGNTKKSVVSTGFFVALCVGGVISPHAWKETDQQPWIKGSILSVGGWVVLIVILIVYLSVVKRENKKRDRMAEEGEAEVELSEDSDLTDKEDSGFRYST